MWFKWTCSRNKSGDSVCVAQRLCSHRHRNDLNKQVNGCPTFHDVTLIKDIQIHNWSQSCQTVSLPVCFWGSHLFAWMCERNAIDVIKIFLNSTAFTWNFIIQTMSDEAVGPFYTHKCVPSQWAFGPGFWKNFGELQFQLTWLLQQESSKTHQSISGCICLSPSLDIPLTSGSPCQKLVVN